MSVSTGHSEPHDGEVSRRRRPDPDRRRMEPAPPRRADRPPSILMLHGGGQNRYSWKNTGQILADDGSHVVALDSRGHGDSDRAPDADYSRRGAVRRHACGARPDRPAGGADRRQHGRADRASSPRTKPARRTSPSWSSSTSCRGTRRTAAPASATSCSATSTASTRSRTPPTPSPPTCRTGRNRAAPKA